VDRRQADCIALQNSNIVVLLDQSRLIRHQSAEICAAQEKHASDVTHRCATMRHFCALGVASANENHSPRGINVMEQGCGAADGLLLDSIS
jgi:hypothetical protein